MTYARNRRRARRFPQWSIRCLECGHLDTPEWAPFCSAFCYAQWSAKVSD